MAGTSTRESANAEKRCETDGIDPALYGGVSDEIDALRERIIGCAIEVHRTLGPGLLESVYAECMVIEMRAADLRVETQRPIGLTYRGQRLTTQLRMDFVVENRLVVELKSVERIHPVHLAQVITYLKLTGLPAGLLLNFNGVTMKAGVRRLVHPDLYVRNRQASGRCGQ